MVQCSQQLEPGPRSDQRNSDTQVDDHGYLGASAQYYLSVLIEMLVPARQGYLACQMP